VAVVAEAHEAVEMAVCDRDCLIYRVHRDITTDT